MSVGMIIFGVLAVLLFVVAPIALVWYLVVVGKKTCMGLNCTDSQTCLAGLMCCDNDKVCNGECCGEGFSCTDNGCEITPST